MLPDNYTAVLQTQSRDDFLREVVGFTKRLGFDTVNATHKLTRWSRPCAWGSFDDAN